MHDNSNSNSISGSTGTGAIGFIVGALVGAGIALLIAPVAGTETRRRIAGVSQRWGGAVRNRVREALERGRNGGGERLGTSGNDEEEHWPR